MCDADPDTLQSLIDKSLVRRREEHGQTRYWMLETIRELAVEQAAAHGEGSGLRRRHAEHYLEVALSANLSADGEGVQRHDLVIPERDNSELSSAGRWKRERSSVASSSSSRSRTTGQRAFRTKGSSGRPPCCLEPTPAT